MNLSRRTMFAGMAAAIVARPVATIAQRRAAMARIALTDADLAEVERRSDLLRTLHRIDAVRLGRGLA